MARVIVTCASAVGDLHHETGCSSVVIIENGIPNRLETNKYINKDTPVDRMKRLLETTIESFMMFFTNSIIHSIKFCHFFGMLVVGFLVNKKAMRKTIMAAIVLVKIIDRSKVKLNQTTCGLVCSMMSNPFHFNMMKSNSGTFGIGNLLCHIHYIQKLPLL